MKIGIISDTHDHMDNIRYFVEKFNEADVKAVLHCGDFVSPFTAREFSKLNPEIKFFAIRGNNDGDIVFLNKTFENLGKIAANYQEVELDGKKILLLHGHAIPEKLIDDIASSGKYNVILYGHYHKIRNEMVGPKTLVVNPGEACGYLSGKATAAILDLSDLGKKATIIKK
ncbi:MAG: metallophosphoesterase [Promethearchaeota archaeon]